MLTSVLFVVMVAAAAADQDSLTSARELYASANYEDALNVLSKMPPNRPADEARTIEQYRAFCLLALGRNGEAERAIEAVVAAAPTFRPSDGDISPRVRAAFVDVRRRMLPSIIQQKYAGSKAAYDRKQFEAAADGFADVLTMMADPDMAPVVAQPPLADMRTLAVGFHDLSVSAIPPPPLPAADVRTAMTTIAPAAAKPAAPPAAAPAAATAAVPDAGRRVYSMMDTSVVPPLAIVQELPKYQGDVLIPRAGQIELIINEAGAVEAAMIRSSVSPKYDELALAAARQWRYRPATLNGAPVKYRKLISVTVRPAGRS
jgi:TonB family protein